MSTTTRKEYVLKKKISIKEAALAIGKSEQFIRVNLQRQLVPYGSASQSKQNGRWNYYISPELFKKYIGETLYKTYIEKGG